MSNENTLLDATLNYAERGWHVFPCKPDKSPYTQHGKDDATTDQAEIRSWWARWPDALIGVNCEPSGILAIDIDNKQGKHGNQAWLELVKNFGQGQDVEVGPVQITPNSGTHLIFKHPQENIPSRVDKLGHGLDLRSRAYIILAPSPGYEWIDDHSPDVQLTEVPEWLLECIRNLDKQPKRAASQKVQAGDAGKYWLDYYLTKSYPGSRNDLGFAMALQLRDSSIPETEAESLMIQYAERAPGGDHPYTEREALAALRSAYNGTKREAARLPGLASAHDGRKPADLAQPPEPSEIIWGISDRTDTANAERLAHQFGAQLRWVKEWGWLAWDGQRWQQDNSDLVMRRAKKTARDIYQEAAKAASEGKEKRAADLAKWARGTLSRTRLDAMIYLAASELPARPKEFDQAPWLLNIENGLLDLRTRDLKEHDPEAKITKIAGTYYDPDETAPTWSAFLDRVLAGNKELTAYLQRAVGYTLTGEVSEQCLFFLHGSGANGKTTFIQTILAMLGEYGQQAAPSLLLMGERHPTEIADLQGARFVATVEVEEGRRLAEVLTKQLTGGDRIKARYMRRNFFEFEPTFKLWLSANHKPIIRGTDYAIWRRIKLIPFEVTIPEDEQDPHLPEKLRAELPGILAWAVQGAIAWQQMGLDTPDKVKRATAAYQGEMDLMAIFIEDCCILGTKYEATGGALYQSFSAWCERNGEKPWTQRTFGMRLGERGFTKTHVRSGVLWSGLGVVETAQTSVE